MVHLPDIPEEQLSLMSESTPAHSPAKVGDEVSAGASDYWTATHSAASHGSSVKKEQGVDFVRSDAQHRKSTAISPSPNSPSEQASVRGCASCLADLGRSFLNNGSIPMNIEADVWGGVEEDRGWWKEKNTHEHGGEQVHSGASARETDSTNSCSSPSGAALAATDGASPAAMDGAATRQQLLAGTLETGRAILYALRACPC